MTPFYANDCQCRGPIGIKCKIKTFGIEDGQLSETPVATVESPRSDGRFQAIPVGFDITAGKSGSNVIVSEARFLTPEFGLREESGVKSGRSLTSRFFWLAFSFWRERHTRISLP